MSYVYQRNMYQRNILIFDTVWKLHIIVPQYTLYILYLTSYIL